MLTDTEERSSARPSSIGELADATDVRFPSRPLLKDASEVIAEERASRPHLIGELEDRNDGRFPSRPQLGDADRDEAADARMTD